MSCSCPMQKTCLSLNTFCCCYCALHRQVVNFTAWDWHSCCMFRVIVLAIRILAWQFTPAFSRASAQGKHCKVHRITCLIAVHRAHLGTFFWWSLVAVDTAGYRPSPSTIPYWLTCSQTFGAMSLKELQKKVQDLKVRRVVTS